MVTKDIDITLFGATGFTGQYVFQYVISLMVLAFIEKKEFPRIAIAGRSLERLAKLRERLVLDYIFTKSVSHENFDDSDKKMLFNHLIEAIALLEADSENSSSMREMARVSKVIVNLTGPFRILGESVIRCCVENECDYVDITGEPEFMERMTYKYDKLARENKVIIVTCCGFDSIPADFGVLKVQEELVKVSNVKEDAIVVESFLSFNAGKSGYCGHSTTWECAVLGIANQESFGKWRKSISSTSDSNGKVNFYKARKGWFTVPQVPGYNYLFPGSDSSVVRRSQSYLSANFGISPVAAYGAYFTVQSRLTRAMITFTGFFLTFFSKFSFGRWLLLKFPWFFSVGAFSRNGPTQRQISEASFEIKFLASWKNSNSISNPRRYKMVLKGPEPGYIATSKLVFESAICILRERQAILGNHGNRGGVFTPASAFYKTSMIKTALEKILSTTSVTEDT